MQAPIITSAAVPQATPLAVFGALLLKVEPRRMLAAKLLFGVLIVTFLSALVPIDSLLTRRVSVSKIFPEIGLASVGRLSDPMLSDHETPSGAVLYGVYRKRGTFLHEFRSTFGGFYGFESFVRLADRALPTATHDSWVRLGPGRSLHDAIRELGAGRYSMWHGRVYLSLPQGPSAPHQFAVLVPPSVWIVAAVRIGLAAALLLLALAARRVLQGTWISRNFVQVLATAVVMFGMIGALIAVDFRAPFTTAQKQISYTFHPQMGQIVTPESFARWTNGVWIEGRANSLGFLDHEPRMPKPADTFRILIMGDGMIEAVQARLEEKVQTVLAKKLADGRPDLKTDVVAIGITGTGQSNQLSYYEGLGKALQPDLVILLFSGDDFANNSVLLESIRQGWDPDHPPRLFFEPIMGSNEFRRIGIDPAWEQHRPPPMSVSARVERLASQQRYAALLRGWNADRLDIDFAFFQETLPAQVFNDAIASTGHALDQWQALAKRDGFTLLVVASDGYPPMSRAQRAWHMDRIVPPVRSRDIPFLDLRREFIRFAYNEFLEQGQQEAAHVKVDGHWNATGHRWAGQAIYSFLEQEGHLPKGVSMPPARGLPRASRGCPQSHCD